MLKQGLKSALVLVVAFIASFVFVSVSFAELETQLGVNNSATTGSVPYLKTQWYGFSATAGQGYRVNLKPSSGNCDLYLFDTNFNLVASSKKSGTTQDPVWYGQSSSGPMHIASYGVYNPSSNFTVRVITSPYLKTMTPTTGFSGTFVTFNGFGFGETQGTNYVQFGTVKATNYVSWTNTMIEVYVPTGVANGTIQAKVYVGGKVSNLMNFTISGISTDVAMWRYDSARTGNYPDGPTTLPLNLKWTYTTGFPILGSATVANGIVYVASDKLYALDGITGALKWSYVIDGSSNSSPAVANGIVYFGSGNGIFYAINANTGSLKWSYNGAYPNTISSPAVVNSVVYFTAGSKFYALDANNGNLKWSYNIVSGWIKGSPAIANGLIYFGDSEGKIYALYATNGAVKWTYTMPNEYINGTPAVANGILYFSTVDRTSGGSLFALDASTGTVKWKIKGSVWTETPAIANDRLYVSSLSSRFTYVHDAITGEYKGGFNRGTCAPSISNGIAYFGADDGYLYAWDVNTMTMKWYYSIGGLDSATNSPVLSNGKVYIGSTNAKIYCFGP